MRIVCLFRDTQRVWETSETEVVFGRSEEELPIILDLSPDQRVSRLHGRIWKEDGRYWIEDLNSSRGTQVNGVEIKGRGKQQLHLNDAVVAGQTLLHVDFGENKPLSRQTRYLEHGTFLLPERRHVESGIAIAKDIDATAAEPVLPPDCGDSASRRFEMISELPFRLATKTTLEALLPDIVDQLVELFRSAESWSLVLRDPESDALLLKAYHYVHRTYLSETLLRRVMTERKAFLWKKSADANPSETLVQSGVEAGMYAPLIWQGEAFGAICVGTRKAETTFGDEDVKLLVLVGQYGAMAVGTHHMQEKLRQEAIAKANLQRQFSPKMTSYLLAHRSRLRPGGRRSEASIVNVAVRGLARLAKEHEAHDVVEMLSDYIKVVVSVIFKYHGTVQRCTADGFVAIFGSPEPDAKHREHAIRAAVEIHTAISALNEARQPNSIPCAGLSIGIDCGEVVHGFIGTPERTEFTAVGEAVNRSASYSTAGGEGEVVISPEMHGQVAGLVEAEQTTMSTRGGDVVAYRVRRLKENSKASAGAAAT